MGSHLLSQISYSTTRVVQVQMETSRSVTKYLNGVLFGVYTRVKLFAHSILPVCLKKQNISGNYKCQESTQRISNHFYNTMLHSLRALSLDGWL